MDFSKLAKKGIDILSALNQSNAQPVKENDISVTKVISVLKNKITFPVSILRETQYAGDTKEGKVQLSSGRKVAASLFPSVASSMHRRTSVS